MQQGKIVVPDLIKNALIKSALLEDALLKAPPIKFALRIANLNTLVDSYQVGRGVKPSSNPRSSQDRSQRRRGRALAIRPRHQHPRHPPFRVVQSTQQDAHVGQIE